MYCRSWGRSYLVNNSRRDEDVNFKCYPQADEIYFKQKIRRDIESSEISSSYMDMLMPKLGSNNDEMINSSSNCDLPRWNSFRRSSDSAEVETEILASKSSKSQQTLISQPCDDCGCVGECREANFEEFEVHGVIPPNLEEKPMIKRWKEERPQLEALAGEMKDRFHKSNYQVKPSKVDEIINDYVQEVLMTDEETNQIKQSPSMINKVDMIMNPYVQGVLMTDEETLTENDIGVSEKIDSKKYENTEGPTGSVQGYESIEGSTGSVQEYESTEGSTGSSEGSTEESIIVNDARLNMFRSFASMKGKVPRKNGRSFYQSSHIRAYPRYEVQFLINEEQYMLPNKNWRELLKSTLTEAYN